MVPPGRSQITGLVLAGGRGARMGGADKGWVLHDGEPLVIHVLRRFEPQVGALLISANRNLDAYRALAEVVTDRDAGLALEEFAGPLAGLLAGLRRASTDWVAIVPCDAPGLPGDLVARLAAGLGTSLAAYASAGGRTQPAFALVRKSTEASLRDFLLAEGRAVHRWFDAIGAVAVNFDDADAFRNVNAPADRPAVAGPPRG